MTSSAGLLVEERSIVTVSTLAVRQKIRDIGLRGMNFFNPNSHRANIINVKLLQHMRLWHYEILRQKTKRMKISQYSVLSVLFLQFYIPLFQFVTYYLFQLYTY